MYNGPYKKCPIIISAFIFPIRVGALLWAIYHNSSHQLSCTCSNYRLPKNRKRNTAFIVFIVILVVLLLIGLLICCVQINLEYFQSDSTEGA